MGIILYQFNTADGKKLKVNMHRQKILDYVQDLLRFLDFYVVFDAKYFGLV